MSSFVKDIILQQIIYVFFSKRLFIIGFYGQSSFYKFNGNISAF